MTAAADLDCNLPLEESNTGTCLRRCTIGGNWTRVLRLTQGRKRILKDVILRSARTSYQLPRAGQRPELVMPWAAKEGRTKYAM